MTTQSNPSDNQTDNLLEASVPYKLERGGIYLVEVKDWALSEPKATLITKYYHDRYQIDIQFVFTDGHDFALQAVPSIKADDQVATGK